MRKFFLLVLVATFSMYASATVTYPSIDLPANVNESIVTKTGVKDVQKIDFETFKEIAANKGVSKIVLTAFGSFWFTDSCGGTYWVEYSGMSWFEAMQVLSYMDPYFCAYPGNNWDITVYY